MKPPFSAAVLSIFAVFLSAGCADDVGSDPPTLTGDVDWVVRIGFVGHSCTGMILSEHWLLTAGHCVYEAIDDHVQVVDEEFGNRIVAYDGTASLLLHPDYQARNLPSHRWNDVGLVGLREGELDGTERARLCGLTRAFGIVMAGDRTLYSVGYGRLPEPKTGLCGPTVGSKKRYDGLSFRNLTGPPFVNALGVEVEGRQDAVCDGDSGAPLLFDIDGAPHAFAVISGERQNDALSRGTLLGPKIQWIEEATANSAAPLDCADLGDDTFECFEIESELMRRGAWGSPRHVRSPAAP